MTLLRLLTAWSLLSWWPAAAEATQRIALFPFELVNTSLEPTRPDETMRLERMQPLAVERFTTAGFSVVDIAPVAAEVEKAKPLRTCHGCELALARQLGAEFAAVGWVQKVSNLILNVNMQVREVTTGRIVAGASVDIRGNTDESWRRGLTYLLSRRILPD